MRKLVGLLLASALTAGCYTWEPIKPTELPKLSGAAVATGTVASGTNRGQVIAVSVAHVEAPDGRLVEIKGEFDARVELTNGQTVTFTHPVRAQVDGFHLTVQGGNRPPTSFPLNQVRVVTVSQGNPAASAAVGAVVGTALGVLIVVLVV